MKMIDNILSLNESYTTIKKSTVAAKPFVPIKDAPFKVELDGKELEVMVKDYDLTKTTPSEICSDFKRGLRMNSFVLPAVFLTTVSSNDFGLWSVMAPVIIPLLQDVARIVFYVNGARATYSFSKSDTRKAIQTLKDAIFGYAIIFGLEAIMIFIETYIDGMIDVILNQGMVMLG